jgi:hypothetical protein
MRKGCTAVIEHFESGEAATLPVLFLNREGDPEPGEKTDGGGSVRMTVLSSARSEMCAMPRFDEQPEASAGNRLRSALFETGQLRIMPRDGSSQVCFTGIGDPDRLFVESIPADSLIPSVDYEGPGCLCSLEQAEAILRRLYRGETSAGLAAFLGESQRSDGLRMVS